MEITVTLPKLRETKGTVLYGYDWKDEAQPKGLAVTNVYVKKHAITGTIPETITLVVKA